VLIVDDNRDLAELLAEALRIGGCDVRVAYDGPTALEVVSQLVPDIALLDIGLPAIEGDELAQRVRSDPRLRDVQLVAIGGYGQDPDRQRSRDAGFTTHLVKPIEVAVVQALIEQLARSQRRASE
jgi:CheY-like chemotaxis protein